MASGGRTYSEGSKGSREERKYVSSVSLVSLAGICSLVCRASWGGLVCIRLNQVTLGRKSSNLAAYVYDCVTVQIHVSSYFNHRRSSATRHHRDRSSIRDSVKRYTLVLDFSIVNARTRRNGTTKLHIFALHIWHRHHSSFNGSDN
jgi:hypothetical protein